MAINQSSVSTPIHPPPNHRFGRRLLGGKVKAATQQRIWVRGRVVKPLLIAVLCALGPAMAFAAEYKVMTWNVADMDLFDQAGPRRMANQLKKKKAIARVIRKVNPDIMLMVEAPNPVEIKKFITTHQLNYQASHLRQPKGDRSYADSFVLLVKNGLNLKSISLETPPLEGRPTAVQNRYLDWSIRGLLVAHIENFTFIGVHLKSPTHNPTKNNLIKRRQQAKSLATYAKQLKAPVIVAGDFNDGPGEGPLEKRFHQPDTMGLLEKTFKRAPGDEKTQKAGVNIDHIMVKNAKISKRRVASTPWNLSDHRPVWAIVDFNTRHP